MNWKKLILEENKSIQQAIEKIDSSSEKIILIVDKKKKLVGTVTDGDIRRCFLNFSITLYDPIKKIMTNNPLTTSITEDDSSLLRKMKKLKINYVPIINNNKILIGLKSIEDMKELSEIENLVVIMAGGFGKRMMPLTKNKPKPLLKIDGMPILEIIIKRFAEQGFKHFYISTYYKSELIKNYFGIGKKWNINIKYLEEKKPLGTAGALQLLPKNITKLPIIVTNGDVITNINFKNLLDTHSKGDNTATICVKEKSVRSDFGIVETNRGLLKQISEKPINKFLINAGIYAININNTPKIKKNTYMDMPTLLNNLVDMKKKIKLYFLYEDWQDIGIISEYNKAKKIYK